MKETWKKCYDKNRGIAARITSMESSLSWLSKKYVDPQCPIYVTWLLASPFASRSFRHRAHFFFTERQKIMTKAKFPRSSVLVYIHKSIKTILAWKEKPDFRNLKCIPTTNIKTTITSTMTQIGKSKKMVDFVKFVWPPREVLCIHVSSFTLQPTLYLPYFQRHSPTPILVQQGLH